MSAGYIQLAAIGQQDAYLTGSPQVTYFLGVYKRHTPFVLEAFEIPFLEQKVLYGTNNICRIPPKGDLIRGLTLKVTLPALVAPGQDWYWPILTSISNAATLVINGDYANPINGVASGIDYYSTYNHSQWLDGTAGAGVFSSNGVTYSTLGNRFTFTGMSNISVKVYSVTSPTTDAGVFWGLDPLAATRTETYNGNVYYVYDVVGGSRSADFTLEQAGWLRNPGQGMPDPPPRPGLFISANQDYPVNSSGYINFGSTSGTEYWTTYDSTSLFSITPGGLIHFNDTGIYVMRVGLGMNTGSVSNVSWGFTNTTLDGPPVQTNFVYTYPWRVNPNPSTPAIFPMRVTTASNVYIYASGTGDTFTSNSWVSINKADDYYSISAPRGTGVAIASNTIPFYSNIFSTFAAGTSLLTDGSNRFTINLLGPMLISGVLNMSSNYVSNVTLMEGTNTVYTYDLSLQGRDPTLAFSIPANVTDTSAQYYINVATSNSFSGTLNFPTYQPTTAAGSTGAWTVLTNLGTFTMNASSESTGYEAWKGFSSSNVWKPVTITYSTTAPYNYVGTTAVTQDTSIVNYYGEWIQLVSPVDLDVRSVTIAPVNADVAPGKCMIFGNSINGNTGWTILKSNTTLSGTTETVSFTPTTTYKYFRVVFTSAYNATNVIKPVVNIYFTGQATVPILLNNSYFIFSQIGVPAGSAASIVLPYNGLMFRPSTSTYSSPFDLKNDYNVYGNVNSLSNVTSAGTLQFSNVGNYLLTGALCTADQVKSLTVTSSGGTNVTYPVGLGLAPPFTISIPFRVSNVTNTYTISAVLNGSTATPNLFSNTFLSIIPISSNTNTPVSYQYYNSVGTLAIATAELKIGGQSIETLTGEYIETWNDLYVPYENQPALTVMTGKYPSQSSVVQSIAPKTYYVNLPFYFYGHPELSIPLASLERQDVEVHVTFRNFSNLTPVTSVVNPSLDATIITEYVYLSDPEIQWFRSSRVEQIITQLQYQSFKIPSSFTSGVFLLDFKNPIREMFFIIQPDDNNPYDYTGNGLQSMSLSFNGLEAFISTTTDDVYLGSLEPFKYYMNFPTRPYYMYTWCTDPQNQRPSGYVNFSRIKQVQLGVNLSSYNTSRTLKIACVSHNILRFENGLAGLMFNSA